MEHIHESSAEELAKDLYLDPALEHHTTRCFLDDQETKVPPK